MTILDLKDKLNYITRVTIYDYKENKDENILFNGIACEIPEKYFNYYIKDGCITLVNNVIRIHAVDI